LKIFLTGGTGFIGSYIAMELVKEGHEVTILARDKNKVPALNNINQINIIQGDLSDHELIERHIVGKDAVILVALKYTKNTGWEVLTDDTLANVRISDIAAKAGVKHFIYTSSTATNDHVYMVEQNKLEGLFKTVDTSSKQHPTTFYGATKAATENFLMAQSYLSEMRINIIRPGYVFGNPIVEGANIQADKRFYDIVKSAINNEHVKVIKHDGTQFIWAGDLAKLYTKILESTVNRKTFFGLSKSFVSWEKIANEAIKMCGSSSQVDIEDKGWDEDGTFFDVSDMKKEFNLEFDPWNKNVEHIDYFIKSKKK
jgi:UDP-glucose 4-epimerase